MCVLFAESMGAGRKPFVAELDHFLRHRLYVRLLIFACEFAKTIQDVLFRAKLDRSTARLSFSFSVCVRILYTLGACVITFSAFTSNLFA